jgi:hypothetical protein
LRVAISHARYTRLLETLAGLGEMVLGGVPVVRADQAASLVQDASRQVGNVRDLLLLAIHERLEEDETPCQPQDYIEIVAELLETLQTSLWRAGESIANDSRIGRLHGMAWTPNESCERRDAPDANEERRAAAAWSGLIAAMQDAGKDIELTVLDQPGAEAAAAARLHGELVRRGGDVMDATARG